MDLIEFRDKIKTKGILKTEPEFYVELNDPVTATVVPNIEIYKEWLPTAIHEFYEEETGQRPRQDRTSRRKFKRFMDKYNVTVHKEDDMARWYLKAGRDQDHLEIISVLEIKRDGIPEARTD